ncbi:condensin complex subunit 2-like [Selaginella moellendorffii]|uniref:condensin complex subunit 2-like n=1 Tax=Selaginella moellendorffii TaxID=88036 RepID=UPI000D1C9878|nr:condensin complex subunit 2-like [Selaginella moellendorffii]|eukprot:XP_024542601.1 condensin complex subunit 2-like [Selaginella moellendorffii]
MEEARSAGRHGKIALKELTQSPGRYLLLSPNDDGLERRQARLARAQKRRSLAFGESEGGEGSPALPENPSRSEQILTPDQVLELLNNCIKLAAENKINQQNTWDLKLIDYLPHIVKADNNEDTQTNFQKASCTLEASAKIYSCRVDSVHTETYKVLGGLHRSAKEKNDTPEACENGGTEQQHEHHKRKDCHKQTLESYESLNVKHFDAAMNVDPLFHQTSAQFDEGGAKGLLLNTLSVYRGCEILFDSQDIPEKCMKVELPKDPARIDLSFASDVIEKMLSIKDTEISPSLSEIVQLIDDPLRKAATLDAEFSTFEAYHPEEDAQNDGYASPHSTIDAEPMYDDGPNDGYASPASTTSNSPQEDGLHGSVEYLSCDPEDTIDWLKEGLGIPSGKNFWAGADYWKFTRPKDDMSEATEKKPTKKKKEPFSIIYTCAPEMETHAFAKPRDLRANLLPQSRQSASTTLPEDLRYEADDLLRLFLRPSKMLIRPRSKSKVDNASETWGGDAGDFWDGGSIHSDVEDNNTDELVVQPRKVQRIEVNYDKTSKQVDVRALKQSIWDHLQHEATTELQEDIDTEDHGIIHFSDVLSKIPGDCAASADPGDLSVHLCFICLLHLANEHGLVIKGCSTMDELLIENVRH